MSSISTWSRCYRHWVTLIAVIALLVGSLALPFAKPVAAASGDYTITGQFTGPGGIQLQGISVNADLDTFHTGTLTGLGGYYTLTVPAGSYTVSFHDPNSIYASGCYSSSSSGGFTENWNTCSTVGADNATGINVTMPFGFTIHGTVYEPDGKTPLGGINVTALVDPSNAIAGANTDGNGTYTLTVLPGSYMVTFIDPSSKYVNGCYSSGGFTIDSNACTTVTVGANWNVPDVTMLLGLHISGTVYEPDGITPLPNINIAPHSATFGWGWTTATDNNGNYTLAVLPGDYTVSFNDLSSTYVNGCYDSGASGNFTADLSQCTAVTAGAANINVELPLAAGYTPQGGGVAVTPATTGGPSPVALTFDNVSSPGTTTLTTSTTAPALPGGYQLAGSATYYDLTTTASFSGTITVCISYAGVTPAPTSLLHYENGAWTDITTSVDATSQTICGQTASLSPFALATKMPPLTITAPSATMTYGGTVPALTPTYSGFVNGDTAASLTTAPTCTTTATSTSPVGTYPVTCSGAVDPNYSFTYVAGTLTIAIADRFVTPTNTTLNVAAPGFLALTNASGATVVVSTQPAGKLTLGSGGSFTYVPKSGFSGTDSFAYRLKVGSSLSAPVTVTIYVVGTGMNCTKCNLSGLGVSGANLAGSNLSSANLAGTRLDHANLTGANLSSAVLSYATLSYANLTGANLSKATLTSANLTGANLTGANLAGANLAGATLQGVTVTGVSWSNAVCPDGSNSSKDGGTCVGHLNH
jgi:hypothetical protein